MKCCGIILAGGKSRRIGFNKLKIKIGSIPLLIDLVFKLEFFCDEIVIAASRRNLPIIESDLEKIDAYRKEYALQDSAFGSFFDFTGKQTIKTVLDDEDKKGIGPIMGIYQGLKTSSHLFSLIAAFDMPFISCSLLYFLVFRERFFPKGFKSLRMGQDRDRPVMEKDARIIQTEKGFEALCGLYSKRCIPAIEESIGRGDYKISGFFDLLDIDKVQGQELLSFQIDPLNFFNINHLRDQQRFGEIWQKEAERSGNGAFSQVWSSFFLR